MTRIISALLLALVASFASAADPAPMKIANNAPERHIVVPGDTLWGISAKFLQEPWRWPEIWRLNSEQIKNPHRIYPGDIIVLNYDQNGNPVLSVAKRYPQKLQPQVFSEKLDEAIPSIPASEITPFLSKPVIVDNETLQNSPRFVALQERRVYIGIGETGFAAGVASDDRRWNIYRPGKPLTDPETNEPLGFEAFYLGTADLIARGEPSTLKVTSSTQEIGKGDWLAPAPIPKMVSYVPRSPTHDVSARVVSVYGGVGIGGTHSVIALNRGKNANLEVGHVLALKRNRSDTFIDPETGVRQPVALPVDRYGLVFVFSVFEKIAYAFVLNADGTVVTNDILTPP